MNRKIAMVTHISCISENSSRPLNIRISPNRLIIEPIISRHPGRINPRTNLNANPTMMRSRPLCVLSGRDKLPRIALVIVPICHPNSENDRNFIHIFFQIRPFTKGAQINNFQVFNFFPSITQLSV